MTARHAAPDAARPGDALVRAGAVVFAVGVVAVVAAVVPAVLSNTTGDLTLVVLAGSLLPLGLGIALLGLLRGARTARRQARAERRVRSGASAAGSSSPSGTPPR